MSFQLKKVGGKEPTETKLIVRGYKRCPFHVDVLEETEKEKGICQYSLKVLGGGRINHDQKEKEIVVYGESVVCFELRVDA